MDMVISTFGRWNGGAGSSDGRTFSANSDSKIETYFEIVRRLQNF